MSVNSSRPAHARVARPRKRMVSMGAHALVALGATVSAAALAQQAEAGPAEAALPPVTVSAAAVEDVGPQLEKKVSSGALGARSQLDTPFSTAIVSGEDLADRQVSKLGDVFALDASASDNSNAYNAWAAYLTVRGMQLDWQNAFKINGLPYVGYGITLPYEQLEQVELLKGASGFMYGFGNPGGTVNYVTRKPTDEPVRSIELGYRSAHIWTEHVDLGGRVGPDNMFGYRLNVTHEEGKPYNAVGINRDSVSLALDARVTRDLTLTFDTLYQKRRTFGQTPSIYTGVLAGTTLPGVISGRGGLYSGNDQHFYSNLQLYTAGLRYAINPDWTLSTNYSFSKASRSRNESTFYLADAAGNFSDFRYDGSEAHQFNQWQMMLEGSFRTGPLTHQLVVGTAWQQQVNRYSASTVWEDLGTGNLLVPDVRRYFSFQPFTKYRNSDITQKSIFASDTVQLSQRWSVLAGLRYTNYEQNGYTTTGQVSSNYGKNGVITPTVALMFKPVPTTTLYASYVEALEPGSVVSDIYANRGELFNPLRSKQYEAGVKTEQGRWSATGALFRIERAAEYANSENFLVRDGRSIFQGLELAAAARLGSQWELGGSLMWLDSEIDRAANFVGNRVPGAPRFVLAGRVAYRVPMLPGLRLGFDAKYTGATQLRAANDIELPGYTVLNFGATYATRVAGKDVTLRAGINNLTNKRYWNFQYADYIQPADPRSVAVTAKVAF